MNLRRLTEGQLSRVAEAMNEWALDSGQDGWEWTDFWRMVTPYPLCANCERAYCSSCPSACCATVPHFTRRAHFPGLDTYMSFGLVLGPREIDRRVPPFVPDWWSADETKSRLYRGIA